MEYCRLMVTLDERKTVTGKRFGVVVKVVGVAVAIFLLAIF